MQGEKKKRPKEFHNYFQFKTDTISMVVGQVLHFHQLSSILLKKPEQLTLSRTSVPEDTRQLCFSHTPEALRKNIKK